MDAYPVRGLLAYDKERSIITVFDMLYRFTQSSKPDAAVVLMFIAILGPWQMPISFLEDFQLSESQQLAPTDRNTDVLKGIFSSRIRLRFALAYLVDICLVKVKNNKDRSWKTLSLHGAICHWCVNEKTPDKRAWILQAAYGLAKRILSPAERYVEFAVSSCSPLGR